MKVLLVDYSPDMWGAEITLLKMAHIFRTDGYDLTLTGPPGQFADAWLENGFPFIPLDVPPHGGIRDGDLQTKRAAPRNLVNEVITSGKTVRRLVKIADGFQAIHSNSLWSHADVALAGRLAGTGTVLDLHDFVRPGLGRMLLGVAAGVATCTVPVSQAVARILPSRVAKRVHVVPRGVDLETYAPRQPGPNKSTLVGCPTEAAVVGIVGRIDPEKNVDRVVKAVADLPDRLSNTNLVVVGEAVASENYGREVRRQAEHLLGDRVHFLGRRSDVPALMGAFDVLVNASDAEPLGGVILEAMATGTPVVAIATGGSPEMIDHGVDGLLVGPDDVPALSQAIQSVIDDRKLAARLGKHARARVERQFTWDTCCKGFENAYDRAAGIVGLSKPTLSSVEL
jgi:glycosyltransferase involved in cell wall biosynthesis